ncbi:MAG: hypothetical protein PUC25_03740, partial [Prevotellaceae bacterium]|nr:hypothetical protein [Prevotellaceae bacterium]
GRGGRRDGKSAQKTLFSEIYIVYMWLKKVILVADNTILGIHKIDKWIPLYRLVDFLRCSSEEYEPFEHGRSIPFETSVP